MASTKPHCSVDYHNFNGGDLDIKAHLVAEGIYTNDPPFTSPPFTEAAFTTIMDNHHAKYEAYKNGGKAQKGAYATARTELITAMDSTGNYVDERPGVDNDMILLSGFTPTKTGQSLAVVPPPPVAIELSLGVTGEMFAQCGAIAGDVFYGGIVVAGHPLPNDFVITNAGQVIIETDKPDPNPNPNPDPDKGAIIILDFTKQRKKHYTGLTKGVDYYFYFFAVNSAGVSQLSEVKILMCG